MDLANLKLPDTISTPEQLQETIVILGDYAAVLRNATARTRTGVAAADSEAEDNLRTKLADLFTSVNSKSALSLEEVEQLMQALQDVLEHAPVVHITLPDLPGGGLKQKISSWLRLNLSPLVLVSFHYNRSLSGGFAVRVGSRLYDFSFRSQLLAKRDVLAKLLKGEAHE